MESDSPSTPHSILEKFEFYFLGLTFTLLGAAIQTSTFAGHSHASIIAEVIGWAGFVLSGLIGLSKVEHISVLIYLRNRKSELENQKEQCERARVLGTSSARIATTGDVMSIDVVIHQVGEKASIYAEQLDRAGKRHGRKDIIQHWTFVLGLLATATARAYDAITPIIWPLIRTFKRYVVFCLFG